MGQCRKYTENVVLKVEKSTERKASRVVRVPSSSGFKRKNDMNLPALNIAFEERIPIFTPCVIVWTCHDKLLVQTTCDLRLHITEEMDVA